MKRRTYFILLFLFALYISCEKTDDEDLKEDTEIENDNTSPTYPWDIINIGHLQFPDYYNSNTFQWIDFNNDGYPDLVRMHQGDLVIHYNRQNGSIIDPTGEVLVASETINMENLGFTNNEYEPGNIYSFGFSDRNGDGYLDLIAEMKFHHQTMGSIGELTRIVAFTNHQGVLSASHIENYFNETTEEEEVNRKFYIWKSTDIDGDGIDNFTLMLLRSGNNVHPGQALFFYGPQMAPYDNENIVSIIGKASISFPGNDYNPPTYSHRSDFFKTNTHNIYIKYTDGGIKKGIFPSSSAQTDSDVNYISAIQLAIIENNSSIQLIYTPFISNITDEGVLNPNSLYLGDPIENVEVPGDWEQDSYGFEIPLSKTPIGVLYIDIDGDGNKELVVSEKDTNNELFVNTYSLSVENKSISFIETLQQLGPIDSYYGGLMKEIDFNNDGNPEVYFPYLGIAVANKVN